MRGIHKKAYRLLLVAEVITKIEPIAIIGYALKIISYGLIVMTDMGLAVSMIGRIMIVIILTTTVCWSSPGVRKITGNEYGYPEYIFDTTKTRKIIRVIPGKR